MFKNFLFITICASSAIADPMYGYDILGLAMQPIQMIKEEFMDGYCIGALEGTFGDVVPALDNLLDTGKVQCMRVHLGNGPCKRNGNCGPGEISPKNIKAIKDRALGIQALTVKYPRVKCYLSPYLEHDEKDKKLVNSWVKALKESAPDCRVVISAHTGYVPPNVLVEKHGNNAKGDVISNDGVSLFDSNSSKYRTGGKVIVFGWIHRFNLRVSGEKTFTQPRKRTNKVTRDNMIQVGRLLKPQEVKPNTQCKSISAPELWKTNAEDYGDKVNDPRGDKPLYISKNKVSKYSITTISGKVIGCAKYYGPYEGLYRHYVGNCSGDSGVELMDKAKSEWILLKGGSKCYLANAIRRGGYWK